MRSRVILVAPRAVTLALALSAVVVAGGCNLISGLSELSIGESTSATTTSGSGGTGATASTGGTGGSTSTGTDHCSDNDTNEDETGRDCGGPTCAPCPLLQPCTQHTDCLSELCLDAVCTGVTQLSVGNAHGCAVLDTGALYCWGDNTSGQLGAGDDVAHAGPVVATLTNVVEVAAGGLPEAKTSAHTCARRMDGSVACWGANGFGQLGKGDTGPAVLTPTTVPALAGAKHIAAGGEFSCAITADDAVACWGANAHGQLADGTSSDAPDPITPPFPSEMALIVDLTLGPLHACAVSGDGHMACWGNNESKQVGDANVSSLSKVHLLDTLSGVTLAGAGNDFTCARNPAGFACWGNNSDAQLTSAVAGNDTATPTPIVLGPVNAFALGADGDADVGNDAAGGHACGALATGKVACWGNNRSGQLGRGNTSEKEALPVEISEIDDAVEVATGAEFSCVRRSTGGVRCWGRNDLGQLGTGTAGNAQSSPVPIAWP